MKKQALVVVMIFGVFGNAFCHPAFAQGSVGGPTKQKVIGGPVQQNSPVLPSNKGGSISVSSPPSHVKCTANPCAKKGTNQ